MPYQDSYVWKMRQKIGHDVLILPSADCLAVDKTGKILLVLNKDFNKWVIPGGYVEESQTSQACAARELLEEGGLETDPGLLEPFGFSSGHAVHYPNEDVTQPYTQFFIARTWQDKGNLLDQQEVSERRWFALSELDATDLHDNVRKVIEAYQSYEKFGRYKIIELKDVR